MSLRRRLAITLLPLTVCAALLAALLVALDVAPPVERDVAGTPAELERSEFVLLPEDDREDYTPAEAAAVDVIDPEIPQIQEGTVVAELAPHDLPEFELLGVTWTDGVPAQGEAEVQVRWRQDGTWSPWTLLEIDDQEVEGGIPGTEPKWIGPSDAAQARIIATEAIEPDGLTLVTVAAGEPPTFTQASAAQPAIITRSQWGARASSGCGSPRFGTMKGTIVHHTAGSNSYTKAQSTGIVKSIQAYHMDGQKWCDVGYNFLVDAYGQIFEGRVGGITQTPRGAHSGNFDINRDTTGVAILGTYVNVSPTAAAQDALVRLVAWRHRIHNVPAHGTHSLGGKSLNRIDGHYRVTATACPGRAVIDWLPTMRNRVDAAIKAAPPTIGGFADVPATHAFASSIAWLSERNISTGYVNGGVKTFQPAAPVLREQMGAFLYRFQDSPSHTPPSTSPFTDLPTSHTFYREISWLNTTKITTGYGSGSARTFQGGQPVLREQMAAFLYRIATLRSGGKAPLVVLPSRSPFADIPTSHPFYREIVWLSQQGISTGYTEANGTATFRGSQPVLREQMAAFLHRLFGLSNFSDVTSSHTFRSQIEWMALSGITPGTTTGAASTFAGSTGSLRREMADHLYAMQGRPAFSVPATSPFSDVATTDPLYWPMTWMRDVGISTGYDVAGGLPEFRPAQPVLREQMAAFLYRLATVRNGREPAVTLPAKSPFTDVPTSHAFYKQIVWMSQSGLTTGYRETDGTMTFRGGDTVLREQVAAFLYRFHGM